MILLQNRSEARFRLMVVLFSLGAVCACNTPTPGPREELVGLLKGANVDSYHFAIAEDDDQVVTSLTNNAVRNVINLDSGDSNVVLRYASVKDKKANTTKVYKAEINKAGAELTLLVADLDTNEVVTRNTFPAPEPHDETGPKFETLEDCIKDFNCQRKGALQCEADRTCESQFAALTCCLTNGQCFSVHLVVKPVSWRCRLRDLIPEVEGFVLSRH